MHLMAMLGAACIVGGFTLALLSPTEQRLIRSENRLWIPTWLLMCLFGSILVLMDWLN
ncbi:hypothetical protein MF271_19330 (plasmid) [Deinococcus sp. KNUC1210]|uniref:hypothetical protein n=1 Tax=Deinococcus sp. KNUC1210 TaxID=2917691 RepID=UPI001EF074C6|nr:hypothetical protein [Deinococcus sp. KNUC1210]ULH17344.1 hypothetical protein MF271_19330 [Deinococcus sp. KNUC1210]